MKTQKQLFDALISKHKNTSTRKFSRDLLSNAENTGELKQFVEDELYFWLHIKKQAESSPMQMFHGERYFFHISHCNQKIEEIKEVISDMKFKVYTDSDGHGFVAVNRAPKPHFIPFN
jgi:hypothetical protein